MKFITTVLAIGVLMPGFASASGDHKLQESCKTECPKAQTEDEAYQCMEGVAKKKKSDQKFKKTDCYADFQDLHEKKEGHRH